MPISGDDTPRPRIYMSFTLPAGSSLRVTAACLRIREKEQQEALMGGGVGLVEKEARHTR